MSGVVRSRGDDEIAAHDDGVVGPARVVLELLVSLAASAGLGVPFGRVHGRAVGQVELVGPDQFVLSLCVCDAQAEKGYDEDFHSEWVNAPAG